MTLTYLGIFGVAFHHSTLSKCINGQREWNPELKARYEQLATSINKSGGTSGGRQFAENPQNIPSQAQITGMVGGTRVELVTSAMSTQRSKPLS